MVNPNYAGDYRGVKPVIEKIIIKTVKSDTMINELASGSVDLLFQCSGADTINGGLDLVDQGKARRTPSSVTATARFSSIAAQFPTDLRMSVRQLPTAWIAVSLPVSIPAATLPFTRSRVGSVGVSGFQEMDRREHRDL